MDTFKKCWIATQSRRDIYSITFESENPSDLTKKLSVNEMLFPAKPSLDHPLRHTINLGLFDSDDLIAIRDTIDKFLNEEKS